MSKVKFLYHMFVETGQLVFIVFKASGNISPVLLIGTYQLLLSLNEGKLIISNCLANTQDTE